MMASYPFAESVALAFPADVPETSRRLMILTGYFDESGTHAGSDVVSVAGYVSTPTRWVRFDEEWREAMADYGLEFFHASTFANRAPPYDEWSEDERHKRFTNLAGIINRHTEFSIATMILTRLFDETFSPEVRAHCGGPYGLAAVATFMETAKRVNEHYPDQWVSYVFESGARGAGQVLAHFQDNQRRREYASDQKLGSLRFENKRQFTPLQAADILAYELYLHLPRQLGMVQRPPRLPILELLAMGQRISWGMLDGETLEDFANVIAQRLEREKRGDPLSP